VWKLTNLINPLWNEFIKNRRSSSALPHILLQKISPMKNFLPKALFLIHDYQVLGMDLKLLSFLILFLLLTDVLAFSVNMNLVKKAYSAEFPPIVQVYMIPQDIKLCIQTSPLHSRFNVTLWVSDVSNLMGWQIAVIYDSAILSCTGAWQTKSDPEYVFYDRITWTSIPSFWPGKAVIGDNPNPALPPTFNGTGKLCIIEFEIVKEPSEGQMLSCVLDSANIDTFIFNPEVDPIPCLSTNGYYEYYPSLRNDLNNDGKVDLKDISLIAMAFGSFPTHPRWNPLADLNSDSKIDLKDVSTVARHFMEHYP